MSLKETITKIAQEEALVAINSSSAALRNAAQQQKNTSGLMKVTKITNSDNKTMLTVDDGTGGTQSVQFIGSGYTFVGHRLFVSNGVAQ